MCSIDFHLNILIKKSYELRVLMKMKKIFFYTSILLEKKSKLESFVLYFEKSGLD